MNETRIQEILNQCLNQIETNQLQIDKLYQNIGKCLSDYIDSKQRKINYLIDQNNQLKQEIDRLQSLATHSLPTEEPYEPTKEK